MLGLMLAVLLQNSGDFPLDEEVKSNLGNDNYRVEFTCKVTKVGESYTYLYSIKNKGKEPVKIKWDTLNKALQVGINSDILLELAPDENVNFALEHPEPPNQVFNPGYVYRTISTENFEKEIKSLPYLPKDVKVIMPKSKVTTIHIGGNVSGALPKSFIGFR